MSIHREKRTGNWVIKTRDIDGKQRTITVNPRNMATYGLGRQTNITPRIAHHLEGVVLANLNSCKTDHNG